MGREVIIEISPKGDVKIEASGFSGSGCKEATAAFEEAIGGKTKTELKPEFMQDARAVQGVQAQE